MSAAEEHRFRELLARALAERSLDLAASDDGRLFLDGRPADELLDLEEMRRICRGALPRNWDAELRRHLESVFQPAAAEAVSSAEALRKPEAAESLPETAPSEAPSLPHRVTEYAELEARLLSAPLRPEELRKHLHAAAPIASLVCRRDLPGCITLIFLPDAGSDRLVALSRATLATWGKKPAEVFRAALQNARRHVQPAFSPLEIEGGFQGVIVRGDSPFTAAYAYFLAAVPGARGSHGSLVAVPNCRCVAACPLESESARDALVPLFRAAVERLPEGAGGCGEVAYWDGRKYTKLLGAASKVRLPRVAPRSSKRAPRISR